MLAQADNVIPNLIVAMESVVNEAVYVKEPKPLTWLKALDELVATTICFITMAEACTIATANEVEEDAVTLFLSFLNDMGVVLWLNETGFRHVVILDVITSLSSPRLSYYLQRHNHAIRQHYPSQKYTINMQE